MNVVYTFDILQIYNKINNCYLCKAKLPLPRKGRWTCSGWQRAIDIMNGYRFVTLREVPSKKAEAAEWFHSKWRVPAQAYLDCMDSYLNNDTEYGWYLCLDGEKIAGGLGVIENDFHDRKDLAPNICAVYTEAEYRSRGIAGRLLDMAVTDCRQKGISPIYLITDHTGFYERYGWEFLCMVQGDGDPAMSRMYIHR